MPPLNPAQRRVIELLGKGGERAPLPDALPDELRADLEAGLAGIAALVSADDQLWVSKHDLATVHTCEAHHVARAAETFEWTVAAARGSLAHKAVELWVHWQGEPSPMELVDEALARLVDGDKPLHRFLGGLGAADRAELRALAVDHVTAFTEQFPRLKREWVPVTESFSRHELLDGGVVLSAKTDLTLGRPGDKVIVDLKGGRPSPQHREDLRFYALVETLKIGLPPRKVASYYLDAARIDAEDVTVGTLQAALHRTVDGAVAMAELRAGRPPTTRPGPACGWCPRADDCEDGQIHLAERRRDEW